MYRTMHGEYGYYSRIQEDQIIRCAHNVARDYNIAAAIEFRRNPEDAWTFHGYVEPSGRVHRVDDPEACVVCHAPIAVGEVCGGCARALGDTFPDNAVGRAN